MSGASYGEKVPARGKSKPPLHKKVTGGITISADGKYLGGKKGRGGAKPKVVRTLTPSVDGKFSK